MRNILLFFSMILVSFKGLAQQDTITIDLNEKLDSELQIDAGTYNVLRIVDMVPLALKNKKYIVQLSVITENPTLPSVVIPNSPSSSQCDAAVKTLISDLSTEDSEEGVAKIVADLKNKMSDGSLSSDCKTEIKAALASTIYILPIKLKLRLNQKLTVKVIRLESKPENNKTWTKIFRTETKDAWLVHYGLTYAFNLVSRTKRYYSKADPTTASKYYITEENDNGPSELENISATVNFTYPFTKRDRDIKLGFTGGFGLNPTLQLSGHGGLSAIINEKIILSSGIVIMQKNKLKGEYTSNPLNDANVVKENLAFDTLHRKVWLPELYITIGFKFPQNVFEKKDSEAKAEKK